MGLAEELPFPRPSGPSTSFAVTVSWEPFFGKAAFPQLRGDCFPSGQALAKACPEVRRSAGSQ
jgi:hypothetical protein